MLLLTPLLHCIQPSVTLFFVGVCTFECLPTALKHPLHLAVMDVPQHKVVPNTVPPWARGLCCSLYSILQLTQESLCTAEIILIPVASETDSWCSPFVSPVVSKGTRWRL